MHLQICKHWPLKGMLVRAQRPERAHCDGRSMPLQHAFHFGDSNATAHELAMPNRLSGYVFVLDHRGRMRWRNSGKMQPGEGKSLISAVKALL